MSLDRTASVASAIDVLDHVLDKGIVIDAWIRVSLGGIDLVTTEARIVVASIGTYLSYAEAIAPARAWRPGAESGSLENQLHRLREQIDRHGFDPQPQRRAEDRLRDALHDGRSTTVTRRRTKAARRKRGSGLNA
ncbi:MAG TPA: gas vesicle structural protein GvpA [Vicinamibacterales bacterium]|nr:gas vesicle structural protein GvpA [Vicinamibacterales bacterium]